LYCLAKSAIKAKSDKKWFEKRPGGATKKTVKRRNSATVFCFSGSDYQLIYLMVIGNDAEVKPSAVAVMVTVPGLFLAPIIARAKPLNALR
jgi:hypothetical protein